VNHEHKKGRYAIYLPTVFCGILDWKRFDSGFGFQNETVKKDGG
jgi:hypothetical protein